MRTWRVCAADAGQHGLAGAAAQLQPQLLELDAYDGLHEQHALRVAAVRFLQADEECADHVQDFVACGAFRALLLNALATHDIEENGEHDPSGKSHEEDPGE